MHKIHLRSHLSRSDLLNSLVCSYINSAHLILHLISAGLGVLASCDMVSLLGVLQFNLPLCSCQESGSQDARRDFASQQFI